LFFNVRLLLSYKKGAFPPEQACAVPEAGRKYVSAGVCFGLASSSAYRRHIGFCLAFSAGNIIACFAVLQHTEIAVCAYPILPENVFFNPGKCADSAAEDNGCYFACQKKAHNSGTLHL
jgi:hypothetical protein